MKNYFKVSSWAFFIAACLLIILKVIELITGHIVLPQWEAFWVGLAAPLACGFAELFVFTNKGSSEKQGYAFHIPILTTGLCLFLAGIIVSSCLWSIEGIMINLLFFTGAIVLICRTMLAMTFYHGRADYNSSQLPLMTMAQNAKLFKEIVAQTLLNTFGFLLLLAVLFALAFISG